jgi:hypothetical protein
MLIVTLVGYPSWVLLRPSPLARVAEGITVGMEEADVRIRLTKFVECWCPIMYVAERDEFLKQDGERALIGPANRPNGWQEEEVMELAPAEALKRITEIYTDHVGIWTDGSICLWVFFDKRHQVQRVETTIAQYPYMSWQHRVDSWWRRLNPF